MPGTFAHIALADSLCQNAEALDRVSSLTPAMKRALMQFNNFCEFGAISSDAPYLTLLSTEAACWANVMHYWKPTDFVRHAIAHTCTMDFATTGAQKCLAWLFGYTTHLVADMTVHPVINLHVGPYAQNKLQHRLCEVNEDVYIFHALGYGEICTAESIKRGGIKSCADQTDNDKLDASIRNLWILSLSDYPTGSIQMKKGLSAPKSQPRPDEWFDHYVTMIDKFAEEGGRFPRLSRRVFEAEGVVYPTQANVDPRFIRSLKLPDGTTADYDVVFELARQNILKTWQTLGAALTARDASLFTLPNADLDTGRNEANQFVF